MMRNKYITIFPITFFLLILFLVAFPDIGYSQDEEIVDRLVVPLSSPKDPCFVEASLVNGGIMVTGYDGKDVIVEAHARMKKISNRTSPTKAKGMIRIPVTRTGLSVEEEKNRIDVSVESWKRTIDLELKVPHKSSLKLSCVNSGDIEVSNVEGELDVNNINGKVTLHNISGAVVAHALNKDLVVTLDKVDRNSNMSFSTLNGDVDVTFPKNFKATVSMDTDNGDIYSDFEIELNDKPRRVINESGEKGRGKYRVEIDRTLRGDINGGGPEVVFKSFNGDIFIRKGK